MKTKRFFLRFILIFTVGANMYFVFKANSEEIEKLPLLTDLEALADDGKFVRGPRVLIGKNTPRIVLIPKRQALLLQ